MSNIYVVFYLISINAIKCFDPGVFLDEFCAEHENEILKQEKQCFPVLQIEIKNILYHCIFDMRNKRAPYKRVDGKYRQFLVCDNALRNDLFACEGDYISKLKVTYNTTQNVNAFQECMYAEILVAKKLRERNKKLGGVNKAKSRKSKRNNRGK